MKKIVHNVESNTIIEVELNEEELAQYEKDKLNIEAQRKAFQEAAAAKAALLEKLGITEEEAKLLLS